MRPKILALLGLSFFVAATATFVLAARWLDSRIFDPLRQPVSLNSAHLHSAPFEINLAGNYLVLLQLDSSNYSILHWPSEDQNQIISASF